MALLCEAYGANVWKVREFMNKVPYRNMHKPGAGVGGHCIPKDSWLLISAAKEDIKTQLIPLARHINDFMPRHMFDLLMSAIEESSRDIANTKVVVLGFAYDANSDDTRMTPTEPLMKLLEKENIEYTVQDPYVAEFKVDLVNTLKGANAVVLMAAHDAYKKMKLLTLKKLLKGRKPILVDGRNFWDKDQAEKLGFLYRGVGNI
jgi:UDP-N-acetyl-D-mannosaminuronic acid dehydrogenase